MVRSTQFKVERTSDANGTRRLELTGELDLATTPRLENEVNRALSDGANSILIGLTNLTFLDSTGLRLFLHLNERSASDGWALTLLGPSEQVRTILRITGSDGELPIVEETSAP